MTHVLGCLWILMGTFEYTVYEGEAIWYETDNWIYQNDYDPKKQFEVYAVAIYFMIETITTVGYGDFGPNNLVEEFFLTVVMIIGVVAFSYAMSTLQLIVSNQDKWMEFE